jgi:excisionase family DNA binding protein
MTPTQTDDEWLSLREAAELLGMHPATVRLWADRNELPSRRTNGGHRRFRRSDIEAHLRHDAERKPSPAAQLLVQSVLGRVRIGMNISMIPRARRTAAWDGACWNCCCVRSTMVLRLMSCVLRR